MPVYKTGWRVRDADTLESELGFRSFWCLVRENGGADENRSEDLLYHPLGDVVRRRPLPGEGRRAG